MGQAESAHVGVEDLGLLHVADVAGPGYDGELRAGDRAPESLGNGERGPSIVLSGWNSETTAAR